MRDEIAAAFAAAKARGEIAEDSDCPALARRYQAYVNALRLELHQGTAAAEVAALADSLAREVEALRRAG